jgi:hypothetical protein
MTSASSSLSADTQIWAGIVPVHSWDHFGRHEEDLFIQVSVEKDYASWCLHRLKWDVGETKVKARITMSVDEAFKEKHFDDKNPVRIYVKYNQDEGYEPRNVFF